MSPPSHPVVPLKPSSDFVKQRMFWACFKITPLCSPGGVATTESLLLMLFYRNGSSLLYEIQFFSLAF